MVREKWDECYMKDVFTVETRGTQLSESQKQHLKSYFDVIQFLKHFERVAEYKRKNEL
jgi:zinc finger SWIM domain-containing protein 3